MDILADACVALACPNCGKTYEVPLAHVLESQAMLNEACACRSDNECPPFYLAGLLDPADLDTLRQTWSSLQRQARDVGGDLLVRPSVTGGT